MSKPFLISLWLVIALYGSCALLSEDTRIRHYRTAGEDAVVHGNYAEAEKQYKAALDLANKSPDKSNLVLVQGDLGKLYSIQNRDSEAEPLFRQRVTVGNEIWSNDSARLSQLYYDLALFYLTKRRYEQGKPVFDQLLSLRERAFGTDAPQVADTLELFAQLFRANGHEQDALRMEERARDIRAKSHSTREWQDGEWN